jgi:hypothetical protein
LEKPAGGAPGGIEIVTYQFGIDDLAAMRFSLSPMYELVMSLVALAWTPPSWPNSAGSENELQ